MTNIRNHQPVNIPAIKILDVVRPTTHCSCGSRLQSDSNFLCLCLLPKHFGWSQKYDHWFNWFSTIVEVEQFPWRFVSLPLLFQVPVNIKHFWNHQLCSHWLSIVEVEQFPWRFAQYSHSPYDDSKFRWLGLVYHNRVLEPCPDGWSKPWPQTSHHFC